MLLSLAIIFLVGLSAAEHKQRVFLEWVDFQRLTYRRRQSVYSLAQICVTAGDVDLFITRSVIQHRALPAAYVPAFRQTHRLSRLFLSW